MARAVWTRTIAATLTAIFVLGACSKQSGNATGAADKAPLFRIDGDRGGPLTLEELQIHTDGNLSLTTDRRDCYVQKIGDLAAAAGDPETADVVALGYVTDSEGWRRLKRDGRRLILAQAIVSRAITFCPETTKVGG